MSTPPQPDIDFNTAGYGGGKKPIPHLPAVWRLEPTGGDDTALLQAAINDLAQRSLTAPGIPGALWLQPGTFRVAGQIRVAASGILLQGSTQDGISTKIVATGKDRRTLIQIGAETDTILGKKVEIAPVTIPAGSHVLPMADTAGLQSGVRVAVERPSTEEWIAALGVNTDPGLFAEERTHWAPGSRDLRWERLITAVDREQRTITLDAPIATALEPRYGGGTVTPIIGGFPISDVGIEDLILESEHDPSHPKDEEHSWIAIAIDRAEDVWVRGVAARHFAGSAVRVGSSARRVTIEGCRCEEPVSEQGGSRRQSFHVNGQQVLVNRCTSERGINDFAVGFCAAGPNVFRDCTARNALGPSGALESWSSGTLFEGVRIEGAELQLTRDASCSQGAGWTAANSLVRGSEAKRIIVHSPPGAANSILPARTSAATESDEPVLPHPPASVPRFPWRPEPQARPAPRLQELAIINGHFVAGGRAIWGDQVNGAWWKGQVSSLAGEQTGTSITRFGPGRDGVGLTENLEELAERMARDGTPFYSSGPAIWYDRRRDDHTLERQPDGNVWAPFFEMPWSRSGISTAWDGLSKYDLTKFNPWYFERTRAFARLCSRHGLVMYHHLYNTHNVFESHSHWVDFPWRPANCINDTGLPEPVPLDANGQIQLGDVFYNVDHPGRRSLHRAYIRHTLDQLGGCPNVIFSVAFQFSGPLAFQEFFLDAVEEWERDAGRRVKIALVTSKDITDAILADPARAAGVAVVDMRYWQTQQDGTLWAPRGDRNRAFRQMTWEQFGSPYGDTPPPTTPQCVYRQVREYRERHPDKAIVAWHGGAGPLPVLMAGGAQALMRNPASGQSQGTEPDRTPLDTFVQTFLADLLPHLLPQDGWLEDADTHWCLADPLGENVLLSSLAGPRFTLARHLPHSWYGGTWFDPQRGSTLPATFSQSWNAGDSLSKPDSGIWLLLLRAKPFYSFGAFCSMVEMASRTSSACSLLSVPLSSTMR